MQYTALGRTGLKVSRLCLGMMTYGTPAWRDWVLPEEAAPIVGASKMPHLEEAVAALGIRLTDEERARLESAYQPHPVLGHS